MTSVTSENLYITSIADVEAIDPETDNRLAVRSLRHAADHAFKESLRLKAQAESGDGQVASLNIRCAARGATAWRERLVEARDSLTKSPEDLKAELLDRAQGQKELAAACLSKAIDILDAHPNGLGGNEPASGVEVEAQDLEDDDEEEED